MEKLVNETFYSRYIRNNKEYGEGLAGVNLLDTKVWDRCASADTWPAWPQSSVDVPGDQWMLELEADIAQIQKAMKLRATVDPMRASAY